MRIIRKFILFLILVFSFSCEEQGIFINCSDCVTEEPTKTDLEIKLDIGFYGAPKIINVYEGNLEDSVLYSSYEVSGTQKSIPVTINKKYTVTTTYIFPDKSYTAVDSATPRVRYSKDQCDDPCYFVYDRVCNLRLKYSR
ncbi:MAG TPA: hypothetical protein VMV77_20965 [Bacteroidales bacterium]|nr:hypothetical protein [Bacteroidales bacterium]